VRGTLNLIQVKVLAVRDELASPHGFLQAEEGILPHRGQTLCCASQQKLTADDRYGSKADIEAPPTDVRFTPKSGHLKPAGCAHWQSRPQRV
jgi:hypothetical protein